MQDYYALLGVTRTATRKEIQAAYRALMKEAHPDATGDQEQTQQAALLGIAWHHLGDTKRRGAYDSILNGGDDGRTPPRPPDSSDELRALFEACVAEYTSAGVSRRMAIDILIAELARLSNCILSVLHYPPKSMMGTEVLAELQARGVIYHIDELNLASAILAALCKIGASNGWFYKCDDPINLSWDDLAWMTGTGRYAQ